jgi:fatty-acyl-CoA synthase
VDTAGRFQIRDRLKDVIKTGGEWISSLALEDLISRIAGVSEVAVIGVPDTTWGERPLALVVPRSGTTLEPQAIRQQLMDLAGTGAIPTYAVPDKILIVDALAKTSVGKLDKKTLRRSYGG